MNDNETTQELYPKYPHIEEANKGIEYRNNKRKEFCEILTEYCEEKLDQRTSIGRIYSVSVFLT